MLRMMDMEKPEAARLGLSEQRFDVLDEARRLLLGGSLAADPFREGAADDHVRRTAETGIRRRCRGTPGSVRGQHGQLTLDRAHRVSLNNSLAPIPVQLTMMFSRLVT